MSYYILRHYQDHKACPACGTAYAETEVIKTGLTRAQALAHVERTSSHGLGWFDDYVETNDVEEDEAGHAARPGDGSRWAAEALSGL